MRVKVFSVLAFGAAKSKRKNSTQLAHFED